MKMLVTVQMLLNLAVLGLVIRLLSLRPQSEGAQRRERRRTPGKHRSAGTPDPPPGR